MTEVRFKVSFQGHQKGDKVKMNSVDVKKFVEHFCVAEVVKPRAKKKQVDSASENKMMTGAAVNK